MFKTNPDWDNDEADEKNISINDENLKNDDYVFIRHTFIQDIPEYGEAVYSAPKDRTITQRFGGIFGNRDFYSWTREKYFDEGVFINRKRIAIYI
jgi:hypothetical protein